MQTNVKIVDLKNKPTKVKYKRLDEKYNRFWIMKLNLMLHRNITCLWI